MIKPMIAIPCCTRETRDTPRHFVNEEYIAAIEEVSQAMPVLLPATAFDHTVFDRVDGLLLTGSPSNVAPWRYGQTPQDAHLLMDSKRDQHNFACIHGALAAGVPIFAICRGFQELNVALGGTLHQSVHTLPEALDHRSDDADPLESQYAPRHAARLTPGGLLSRLLGSRQDIEVNSLHSQGIHRLADTLAIEAVAPDGLIEAVSLRASPAFVLGVQWHPEWRATENRTSKILFESFGKAAEVYRLGRALA